MASAEGARAVGIGWEPAPTPGWVAPHLEAEFPGLSLATVEVDGRPGRSPEPVRRRLRDLSNRLFGAEAIRLRGRPIPWAYRVFFRQIGLDPDRHRTPVEQLVLDRLQDGCFRSRGMPLDALTIATIETGVALRVFDADRLDGELCIRDAAPGEWLPGRSSELATGTLTIADESGPVGLLFGATGRGRAVERESRRFTIAAVGVGAVPMIAVEEALWIAASALEAA
jgi:DNA/RNA-binding domain of Phe-tRNA-synthetase-like protein